MSTQQSISTIAAVRELAQRVTVLLATCRVPVGRLAKITKLSTSTIYALRGGWGGGHTRSKTCQKLAEATGVSLDWLRGTLGGSNDLPLMLDEATGQHRPFTRQDFIAHRQRRKNPAKVATAAAVTQPELPMQPQQPAPTDEEVLRAMLDGRFISMDGVQCCLSVEGKLLSRPSSSDVWAAANLELFLLDEVVKPAPVELMEALQWLTAGNNLRDDQGTVLAASTSVEELQQRLKDGLYKIDAAGNYVA